MYESRNQKLRCSIWSVVILILTILRLGMFMRYPYHANGSFIYDDIYLLNLADSLSKGEWLGGYSYVTLIKGSSYPFFVAISNLLCMPYSMLLGLFYLISAAVFCSSIKNVANNRWLASLAYILLIFSPISFDTTITQRLYRNAIIFPSVLLVMGCILKVYYSRKEKSLNLLAWLVCLGLVFSFFYFIREDSFWLLPLFIGALLVIAVWYIGFSNYSKDKIIKRCSMLIIPIVIFLGIMMLYRFINYSYYGVDTINDRTGGSFATLTGNMIKIEDRSDIDVDYWIPRETLERIVDECPSLTPHKDTLMKSYSNWAEDSGNVRGDLSVWAFREALNSLGYYSDANTIEMFCSKVNSELLTAVDEGRLSFDNAYYFTTQSRGIYWQEVPEFIKDTLINIWNVLTFKDAFPCLIESTGTDEQIRFMESITGVQTIHQPSEHTQINGWILIKDKVSDEITLKLRDKNTGKDLSNSIYLYERPDVAQAYPDVKNSLYSGFSISLNTSIDITQGELEIYSGNNLIAVTALESVNTEQFSLHFDTLVSERSDEYNRIYSNRILNLSNYINLVFKLANQVLLYVSLGGYIFIFWNFLRKRSWVNFEPFIILSGIMLSVFVLEFGVTVFNSWLGSIWFYSCGAVPMGQAFTVLSVAYIVRYTQRKASQPEN